MGHPAGSVVTSAATYAVLKSTTGRSILQDETNIENVEGDVTVEGDTPTPTPTPTDPASGAADGQPPVEDAEDKPE
jgi:hypothetical protein